jgi:hypothetical protein
VPAPHPSLTVDWDTPVHTSRTTLTTHLWTAPPLRRGTPAHDNAFAALGDLKADHARFLPYWTHPRLSVPQLHPPTEHDTHWDFELLDPFVEDFMAAAQGRPVVANLATLPAWMFNTPEPVPLHEDPDTLHWTYEPDGGLRDPTLTEAARYYERMARWYTQGGFTDENGHQHTRGHHYRFAYTRLYDQVVKRLRDVDPDMKFIGLSLSPEARDPEYFWHFLDPANHEPGIPLDAFSYHFYATPDLLDPTDSAHNAPFAHWPGTFFAQAEGFLEHVRTIESIKQRLSPHTQTHINEIGSFNPDTIAPEPDIPDDYWALGGALTAYLWSRLNAMGIDLVGVAEFMDYPGMVPGTSLVDWHTGAPNARYRVLQLLLEHFAPGDTLVHTTLTNGIAPDMPVHAQALSTPRGRRLLLVNKYAHPVPVELGEQAAGADAAYVDTTTGSDRAHTTRVEGTRLDLGPFATAVISLP